MVLVLAFPAGASAFGPLSSFGVFGEGPAGGIEKPRGVAIAGDGSAYVVDSGNFRVDVFSPGGSFVRAFGKSVNPGGGDVCTAVTGCQKGLDAEGAGAMDDPQGLAIGPEGNVFVADQSNNRVDVFSPDGVFVRAFGKGVNPAGGDVCTTACERGDGVVAAGDMSEPTGIAIDSSGAVYVADYGNNRIDVFSVAGAFSRAFAKGVNTGPGNPDVCMSMCKSGVLVDGAAGEMRLILDVAIAPGDQIVVANSANNRIDVFSSDGTFIRGFGKEVKLGGGGNVCTTSTGCQEVPPGAGAGALNDPSGVTADAEGNVYVSEFPNDRVSEFTLGGAFIRAFGAGVVDGAATFQICSLTSTCQQGLEATVPGATPDPFGLTVDCRGALYVSEESGGFSRIERFGDVASPPPCTKPQEAVKVTLRKVELVRRLKFRIKLHPKRGTATVSVSVAPLGGQLYLHGKGIRPIGRKARRHGCLKRRGPGMACSSFSMRMPVKPTHATMETLNATGEARVRMVLTYTPIGGDPATKRKAFTLRKLNVKERR
jgi:DNA-binding beta-propeller fold protein YncE